MPCAISLAHWLDCLPSFPLCPSSTLSRHAQTTVRDGASSVIPCKIFSSCIVSWNLDCPLVSSTQYSWGWSDARKWGSIAPYLHMPGGLSCRGIGLSWNNPLSLLLTSAAEIQNRTIHMDPAGGNSPTQGSSNVSMLPDFF